jgi:DNA mismatch endonuclease (patch repair protein)
MSAIKSKDTEPERLLGSTMWKMGLRYRKHYPIRGKPDFVLTRAKLAIFCDGDFWHGNNWRIRGLKSFEDELSTYSNYWADKITSNIERDKKVNAELESLGWRVIRFWESDIRESPDRCAKQVYRDYRNEVSRI